MIIKPFFRDLFLTFVTEISVLLSFFFIYRLIADIYGSVGVGEYSLIKRVAGLIQPLLLLGLGVGIPRYVAMTSGSGKNIGYLKTGGLVSGLFALVFLFFANLFKKQFSLLFFGSIDYAGLVFPFSFLLGGLIMHALVYSYFRGRSLSEKFNLLQMINLAVVPTVVLLFFKSISMERFIGIIGISTFGVAFLFAVFFIKNLFLDKLNFRNCFKELFYYSIPRCAGDFLYAGLFSLGPIFIAHAATVREVGYLSLALSLLAALGALIGPLGLVLLPKLSSMIVADQKEVIRENLNFFIGALIQCSMFLSVQLIIFSDLIIKFWLGDQFVEAVPVLRIVFLSVMFYSFYSATVSILNASKVKPLDMINVSSSLIGFLVLSGLFLFVLKFASPIIELSLAFTLAMMILGLRGYISIRSIYRQNIKKDLKYLFIGLSVNTVFAGMAISARFMVVSNFLYLIGLEAVLGIFYLMTLWFLRIDWMRQALKRIAA